MKLNINGPVYVVAFTALVTTAFTAAVMSAQVATDKRIARNEALRFQTAAVQAFNLAEVGGLTAEAIDKLMVRRVDDSLRVADPQSGREFQVLRAYSTEAVPGQPRDESKLTGYAFEVSGRGLWAPITGLMALTPDLDKVIGIVFTEHKETPGLGGRISEDWFQQQFRGLDVSPPPEGYRFVYVAQDSPTDKADPRYSRTVDAITGATQTSMAVDKFLNESLRQFRRAMQAAE